MAGYTCRYPDGNIPMDLDSEAARAVTVTIDPEDAISILRTLREACCPKALLTVGLAITHDPERRGR